VSSRRIGAVVFGLGVAILVAHTVVLFVWWTLLPVPYPLYATSGTLYWLSGITPMLGPLVMLIGSLVYGRRGREVAR
jgi:hypothetical protein